MCLPLTLTGICFAGRNNHHKLSGMHSPMQITIEPGKEQKLLTDLFTRYGVGEKYKRGDSVFREGDPYRGIFLVLQGSFKWYRKDALGDEGVLKIYIPGEVAGLPPLFDKEPKKHYVANLIALTDGRVSCWDQDRLHRLMHHQPELLYLLNQHYCATLKELIDQTASLSLKSVPDRLLDFLKKIGAEENWVQLPFKKKQLAATLNTSPETISRSLKSLVREGKLAVDRNKFRMLH